MEQITENTTTITVSAEPLEDTKILQFSKQRLSESDRQFLRPSYYRSIVAQTGWSDRRVKGTLLISWRDYWGRQILRYTGTNCSKPTTLSVTSVFEKTSKSDKKTNDPLLNFTAYMFFPFLIQWWHLHIIQTWAFISEPAYASHADGRRQCHAVGLIPTLKILRAWWLCN